MSNPAQLESLLNQASIRVAENKRRIRLSLKPDRRHRPDLGRSVDGVPAIYREAINDCAFGREPWPLTFAGPIGIGKTRGALCLADHVPCRSAFYGMAELIDLLHDAKCDRLELHTNLGRYAKVNPRDFWRDWHDLGICFIDEIGSRDQVSEHRYETLQRALDEREGKPLVLTCNLDERGIAEVYDDRLASRIAGGNFVWLDADDRRLQKTKDGVLLPQLAEDIEAEAQLRQRLAEERACREARAKRKRFGAMFATLPPDEQESIIEAADKGHGFSKSHVWQALDWRSKPFSFQSAGAAIVTIMERRGLVPAVDTPPGPAVACQALKPVEPNP